MQLLVSLSNLIYCCLKPHGKYCVTDSVLNVLHVFCKSICRTIALEVDSHTLHGLVCICTIILLFAAAIPSTVVDYCLENTRGANLRPEAFVPASYTIVHTA